MRTLTLPEGAYVRGGPRAWRASRCYCCEGEFELGEEMFSVKPDGFKGMKTYFVCRDCLDDGVVRR